MTSDTQKSRFDAVPDKEGRFGVYGGRFVAETLMSALAELETLYRKLSADPDFQRELDADLGHYVGRPSPLYEARRWSEQLGGALRLRSAPGRGTTATLEFPCEAAR